MKVAGAANLNSKPIQTIEDMLRIAKKVNSKLKSSLQELEKDIASCQAHIDRAEKEAVDETGVATTLNNALDKGTADQRHENNLENLQPPVENGVNGDNGVIPRADAVPGDGIQPPRLEKPSCLQLTSVHHARQSTTSTITSDYFSMNSKENNEPASFRVMKEEDVVLETRYEKDEGLVEDEHPTCFEDQATQTEDEDDDEEDDDDDNEDDSYCSYNGYGCPSQSQSHEELSPGNYNDEKDRMIISSSNKTHSLKMKLKGTKSVGGDIFLDPGGCDQQAACENSQQMLPIFQRLLEDKKGNSAADDPGGKTFKSRSNNAASCPDISLRCDIVEYL
jgi:hypothetical protein